MTRVSDPSGEMAWLPDLPPDEAFSGYDALGWPASTWVLHAMYENHDLAGLGTHDDVHRQRLESGAVAPLVIGGIDFDSVGTLTGTELGYVSTPGPAWRRITWHEYLARFPDFTGHRDYPPCHRWLPPGSFPVAIEPPPEGSLDEATLDALTAVLATHSPAGRDTHCFAFYAALPTGDFDTVHLWEGPLRHVRELISANGGPYGFSPSNLWSADHGWFVWTDYDLQGTKVSGDQSLIDDLVSSAELECIDWDFPPSHSR